MEPGKKGGVHGNPSRRTSRSTPENPDSNRISFTPDDRNESSRRLLYFRRNHWSRELGRQRSRRTRVNTSHTENTLRIIEPLPVQIQNRNLHGTGGLALFTLRALHRVPVHPQHTVLLKRGHYTANRTNVATPETGNLPSSIDETDQYDNVQPC